MGQAAGRLLLRVPARRAVHPARLPQVRLGTDTSARACATAAIPARRCIWARAGTAWPGACIEPTAGAAGAADGGTPTTRSATASTAAATPASAKPRRAGCASNRPACVQEPGRAIDLAAAQPIRPAAVLRQHALPTARAPRAQDPKGEDPGGRQTGSRPLAWRQESSLRPWTPTRPWCSSGHSTPTAT